VRLLRALVPPAIAAVSFIAGYVAFSPAGKPRADGAAPAGTLRGIIAGRFSAASEERVAAVFAAFEVRDPLRRDAAVFRAIQALEPGDALGALGDLPALVRRVEKMPHERWPEIAAAALEHWLDVDEAGALRWAERARSLAELDPKKVGPWDARVVAAMAEVVARRRPEWLREYARDLPNENIEWPFGIQRQTPREAATQSLFTELARRDPARGRRWIAELPDGPERHAARRAFTRGLAGADPSAALAFARAETEPGRRVELIRDLVECSDGKDATVARAAVAEVAEERKRAELTTLALRSAITRADDVPLDWLEEFVATPLEALSPQRAKAQRINLSTLLGAFIERDPAEARAWVESLAGLAREQAAAAWPDPHTR
jgi:hypothetical protein